MVKSNKKNNVKTIEEDPMKTPLVEEAPMNTPLVEEAPMNTPLVEEALMKTPLVEEEEIIIASPSITFVPHPVVVKTKKIIKKTITPIVVNMVEKQDSSDDDDSSNANVHDDDNDEDDDGESVGFDDEVVSSESEDEDSETKDDSDDEEEKSVVSIKVEGKEKKIKNKDGEEDEDFDEDEENVCITPTKSISKKNKRVIQDDEEAEESSEPKKKISKSSNSKISKEESPLTKALQINRSKPNAVKLGTAKTFVYILKFKNNIIGLSLNGWWLDLREHISKPNTNYILKTGKVIKCKFNFYYIPHKDITEIHNKALIEANETNYKIGTNISKLWLKDGILSGFNRLVFAPSAHFVPGTKLKSKDAKDIKRWVLFTEKFLKNILLITAEKGMRTTVEEIECNQEACNTFFTYNSILQKQIGVNFYSEEGKNMNVDFNEVNSSSSSSQFAPRFNPY